ncbi:hypothetical protein MBLNU230_g3910t1 [Neophaeotheca triangularis]
MTTPTLQPLIFYDITSGPPLRTIAPNPWKTRLALNHKNLPYHTQWTDMPDIANLRQSLSLPANRSHANGEPFHTLPILHDPNTGALIGDSFEIALYLETTYPHSGRGLLFAPATTGLTAAWNAQVDGVFTRHVALVDRIPLNPDRMDETIAMFMARAKAMPETADLSLAGEKREAMLLSFEQALAELAKVYAHVGGTTDWVWRRGGTVGGLEQRGREVREVVWVDEGGPRYADFVVGGWLLMCEMGMREEEWESVRGWQGGLWGRIVDALAEWRGIK